jgi:hypothetical protein
MLTLELDAKIKTVSKKSSGQGPGLAEATALLMTIDEALRQITDQKQFLVTERDKMFLYPNLKARIEEFRAYAENLSPDRFTSTWYKHIGGMVIPWYRRNGNIHLYLIDNGLLSKSLRPVPDLTYEQRSAFFLNRIMGLDPSEQRKKSRIHLHVFDVKDLADFNLMAIKNAIATEHESRGNFMSSASVMAFSLRKHCPDGGEIKGHPLLATNRPGWFKRQFPKWLLNC